MTDHINPPISSSCSITIPGFDRCNLAPVVEAFYFRQILNLHKRIACLGKWQPATEQEYTATQGYIDRTMQRLAKMLAGARGLHHAVQLEYQVGNSNVYRTWARRQAIKRTDYVIIGGKDTYFVQEPHVVLFRNADHATLFKLTFA